MTVAVIDSGVDSGNPVFGGRVRGGTSLLIGDADRGIDRDGHGTGMASDIGSSGGDGRPLGVAPRVGIMPIRVDVKSISDQDRAIRYAVDHGAGVINISQGGSGKALASDSAALKYAFDHDVVVVAAAGNTSSGNSTVSVPANVPGVVAVSGVTESMRFWSGSAHGPETVLAAPATNIVSVTSRQAHQQGDYVTADGTSDAAAIVSGVAALVRSRYPGMSAANVINRLIRTARNPDGAGRNEKYGFGIVDPVRALTADVPKVDRNPLLPAAEPSPSTSDSPAAAAGTTGSPVPWVLAGAAVLVVAVLAGVLIAVVRRRGAAARSRTVDRPSLGAPPPRA
ncbi:S8 family serine peptidase [Actinocatenispora rupis]|uniref:S8 family serine peptidase n=1 Tax=Actinocatenispora rupis TaxID=519421 RepID=UPI00194206F1|nr:S8 family serine peptidase [Actinocatenispora rupis]